MKEICRCISAELLKLKRTLALRLALLAPSLVVLLVFGANLQRPAHDAAGVNPLTGVAQLVLTLWSIITLPFYAALVAALLAAVEYQGDNWSRLLALPVRRFSIYAAKWFVAGALLLVSSVALAAAVCLASEMLRLIKPGWRGAPLPAVMVTKRAMESLCATGLLLSLQLWVSLRWPNFIAGLAVATAAVLTMFLFIPRGAGIFGSMFPWSLPAFAMAPVSPHRVLAMTLGLLGGVAIAGVACWDLSRREQR